MPDAVSPATSDPTIPGASVLARRGEGLGAGRFEARFEERSREDERVDLLLGRPDGTDRDRLIRWARALAAVSHPSLPAIVRIDDETESGYVAFEHIDGPTLAERLSHHDDGLPEVEALAVTLQTASVLEACHQQGLAHGAIDAEVIILAERAGGLDEVFLTGWTPPRDEEDFIVRLREDIRALGGVLYQTLTGLAAPSTQPSEVEDLEGDGGRFDGVLLDWVEVGRDLRGMGEPALQALSESESMDDVGAFARALFFGASRNTSVSPIGVACNMCPLSTKSMPLALTSRSPKSSAFLPKVSSTLYVIFPSMLRPIMLISSSTAKDASFIRANTFLKAFPPFCASDQALHV